MDNYKYLHKQNINEFLNYHKKNNIKIQNFKKETLNELLNSKNKYFKTEYKIIENYSNKIYNRNLTYQNILSIFQTNLLMIKILKNLKNKNIIIYQELCINNNERIDYLIETNKKLLILEFKINLSNKSKINIKANNQLSNYKNLLKTNLNKEIKILQINYNNEYNNHIKIKNKISNIIMINKYSKIINQETIE